MPKDARGVQFKLKKINCALFLTSHPPFAAKIERRLMALPPKERSINQTSANFIKYLPLIASFKLERQTLGMDPLVQLGIWSAALAERLGKLQEQEEESGLMAMPAISIVGHDWKVYYNYTTKEGERVCLNFLSSGRPWPYGVKFNADRDITSIQMLQGPDTLGSTTDFVGIYSIMKAIQVIAEYGIETYMPWFEQHILDSMSSGTDANL